MAMRNNDGRKSLAAGSVRMETSMRQEVRPQLQVLRLHMTRWIIRYAGAPAIIAAIVVAGLVFLHISTAKTPPVDQGHDPFQSISRGTAI